MSFHTGIYNALSTDPTLTTLIPASNVFYQRIPPGVKMPLLVFFTVGGPEPNWTFEPDYWEEIQFQVNVFTNVPDTTTAAAQQADHLLTWKPIVFDTVRNMGIFRTSPLDNLLLDPEPDEADLDVWMTPLFFTARLIRSL